MELFRRNNTLRVFVIIKGNVIHEYLSHKIAAVQKQLVGIASLVKAMSGKSTSVSDYTHCINKETVRSESNINHKIQFSMKFHVISNIFLFIS
jgi:hypothetical protein